MRSAGDLAVLEALAAGEAQQSFWAFRQFMDPGMILGWWQRDAAEHLQEFHADLQAGKRPKLIIQAPPQHGKSETIIDFVAWCSGRSPDVRTIYASFSERLGIRANMSLQRKFDLERFRKAFPQLHLNSLNAVTQATGQALRNREILEFVDRKGYFRNTTVGGAVTGESADLIILDDPLKGREEANSETVRNKTWAWLTDDLLTRASSNAGLLCILTRWHIDDPAARLIKSDPSVKVLSYPAVAEDGDQRGVVDRRHRQAGEALFPELKPLDQLEQMRNVMDPGSWASLYQQRPTIAGGNLFHIDQFQRHRHGEERPYKRRMIFADTAQKTGERNDYSVFQCWGLGTDGAIYLIDQARGKFEAPELEKLARSFWKKHRNCRDEDAGYLTAFGIEDKVSGTGLVQQLQRGPDSIPIRPIKRLTDKYSRAMDTLPSVAAGLVSIPADAPFTTDLLAELAEFPAGTHDDQVDPLLDAVAELLLGSGYDWGNMDSLCRIMGGGEHDAFRQYLTASGRPLWTF
ncbi:phage terminase large subunit [Sphingomonas sp.]|uniref:phage terminase large subunit n=1 Tax=Sphingomonas sp. TaxID=28214 RepID=UPI0025F00835|nr:phage terminase large subunit [Sphingomonas sp.]MBV9528332.1 phage terminase large subunit [Sphingomonas sp.]